MAETIRFSWLGYSAPSLVKGRGKKKAEPESLVGLSVHYPGSEKLRCLCSYCESRLPFQDTEPVFSELGTNKTPTSHGMMTDLPLC
jgi:hypothetical protein